MSAVPMAPGNDQASVQSFVSENCRTIDTGTYMSIYADTAISSSTFGWISPALDSCG